MAMQKRKLKQPSGHNMSHYFPSGYRRLWDSVVGHLEALFRILSREKNMAGLGRGRLADWEGL